MDERAKRLRIHGRVQGVFYRAWAVKTASALDLGGWVRNRRDGTVEILVSGDPAAIGRLVEECREGPPAARVARIDVEEAEEDLPAHFEKRPTL